MKRPTLFISHDADADWLTAIEFGHIDDGVESGRWEPISCRAAWLLDKPGGEPIGVQVQELSTADLLDEEQIGHDFAPFMAPDGPQFDAPTLGLVDVTAADVLLAANAAHKDESTLNRALFQAAVETTGTDALRLWNHCLETGDLMAHYGLGYTKFELGDFRGAYDHLRYYTTLATHSPWAWCWLGRAALAEAHKEDGVAALQRAVELGLDLDEQTDAEEMLEWVL